MTTSQSGEMLPMFLFQMLIAGILALGTMVMSYHINEKIVLVFVTTMASVLVSQKIMGLIGWPSHSHDNGPPQRPPQPPQEDPGIAPNDENEDEDPKPQRGERMVLYQIRPGAAMHLDWNCDRVKHIKDRCMQFTILAQPF